MPTRGNARRLADAVAHIDDAERPISAFGWILQTLVEKVAALRVLQGLMLATIPAGLVGGLVAILIGTGSSTGWNWIVAVLLLVAIVVVGEVLAAVLPLIIVIALVPPEQRPELAKVLAAVDSSRRLRFWSALRVAVRVRRQAASSGASTASRGPSRSAPGVPSD